MLQTRLDPGTAVGLAPTLALVIAIGRGVAFALLAYLVRLSDPLPGRRNHRCGSEVVTVWDAVNPALEMSCSLSRSARGAAKNDDCFLTAAAESTGAGFQAGMLRSVALAWSDGWSFGDTPTNTREPRYCKRHGRDWRAPGLIKADRDGCQHVLEAGGAKFRGPFARPRRKLLAGRSHSWLLLRLQERLLNSERLGERADRGQASNGRSRVVRGHSRTLAQSSGGYGSADSEARE